MAASTIEISKDWYTPSFWPSNNAVDDLLGKDNIFVNSYFWWEEYIRGPVMANKIRSWYIYPPIAAIVYIFVVKMGPKIMERYPAMNLKGILAAWNLFLSLFSIMGFFRLMPLVFAMFMKTNLTWMTCTPPAPTYAHDPFGAWVSFFAFSKYIELFDTAFLILRKRPVNFLHWFHHATVLVYTFDACNREVPIGIFFVTMNLFVHSIMYFYYFLAAVTKPPRWGKIVTVLQISQMFGGIFFIGTATKNLLKYGQMKEWRFIDAATGIVELPPFDSEGSEIFFSEQGCNGNIFNYSLGFMMYGAYLYLFCEFFVQRYIFKGKSIVEGSKSKEENQSKKSDVLSPEIGSIEITTAKKDCKTNNRQRKQVQ